MEGGEINMADTENTGITEIRVMSRCKGVGPPVRDRAYFQYDISDNPTDVPPILHGIEVNGKWATNAKKIRVTVDIIE